MEICKKSNSKRSISSKRRVDIYSLHFNNNDPKIFGNQSNEYLQWALMHLSMWQTPKSNAKTKIFQIHGELDKTFPIKLIHQPHEVVENAGHFMVYKQAAIISDKIERALRS